MTGRILWGYIVIAGIKTAFLLGIGMREQRKVKRA